MVNRATFIEKLTEVQRTVQQLLDQLQASEQDKFAAHLHQAPQRIPACLRPGKQGRKANRTLRDLNVPNRAELWIQERLPRLGELAADRRLIEVLLSRQLRL